MFKVEKPDQTILILRLKTKSLLQSKHGEAYSLRHDEGSQDLLRKKISVD